jgi:hypothetical protein
MPAVSLTPVANFLPVSLIPVVHLEKIRNSPNGILWGWGKLGIHEKNRSKKSRAPLSLLKKVKAKFRNCTTV